MDALIQDVKFALRSLRRTPGFALTVIAVMALGIGVNAFIYTAVRAIVLASLPFAEPGRIVSVLAQDARAGGSGYEMSLPDTRDVMERSRTLSSVAAWTDWGAFVASGGEAQRFEGAMASAGLPKVLGVSPTLGRWFTKDECTFANMYVPVVLGHRMWKERFAGDPNVLDDTVVVNGRKRTVVGVMPEGFHFPEDAEIYVPLAIDDTSDSRGAHWLEVAGRMAPGVELAQARAEVKRIGADLGREYPKTNKNVALIANSIRDEMTSGPRPAIIMLALAVLFVLLIACANVANLQLVRAAARVREVGVRIALGATRARLVRQMVTESLILSLAGGVLGVVIGNWAMSFTLASIPIPLPYWMKFELDGTVLLAVLAVTVLAGLAFGLAPALQATSGDLLSPLREGTPGGGDTPSSRRMRGVLVVAEVALAVVLLIGSGLMVRSFLGQMKQGHALRTEGVLTGWVTLPGAIYKDDAARAGFFRELRPMLAALPGVRAVGGAVNLHLGTNSWTTHLQREGMDTVDGERPHASFNVITPGYMDAIGLTLLRGRQLRDSDTQDAPRVCIVNEAAARLLWPNADPLGKRLRIDTRDSLAWMSVVGVIGSVRQRARTPERPLPEILVPHAQAPGVQTLAWAIRAAGDPGALAAAVRRTLRARDPNLPFYEVRSMGEHLRLAMWEPRLYAQLMTAFSVLALIIAALGIYGVMAYTVSQRTREIGIRMALGAARADVQRLIVGQAVRLTLLGAGLGLALAFGLTRFMQSQLFGIRADDPPTFAGVTLILALSAAAAAWLPTARAVRVDPVVALRHE